jgi:hypothetical protein
MLGRESGARPKYFEVERGGREQSQRVTDYGINNAAKA